MYTRIYILRFPKDTSEQPFIYQLVKKYDIESNILKADILPHREGMMILGLKGGKNNVKAGLEYLQSFGVRVERLAASIRRDDDKCFQCGECTGVCPSGALAMHHPDMAVLFDADQCTGCGQCVTICPVRAMEVSLGNDWAISDALTV